MSKITRLGLLAFAIAVTAVLLPLSVVTAVDNDSDSATKNISQSFNTTFPIKSGSIVSLDGNNTESVVPTNTKNASKLVGVAVPIDSSLVAVDQNNRKVQVATTGAVQVLVSTVNGDIKQGDRIAASPFGGIGMKSLGEGYIVGVAVSDFSSSTDQAVRESVTDANGAVKTITVGYVSVNLKPGFAADGSGGDETGLQEFVRSLTGNTVSMPRIIVSVFVAVVAVVGTAILMYAAIYGSIISIGRNPLARESILRALVHVVLMAVLIFGLAFGLIYLLLG